MKNKNNIYVLVPCVLLVWGLIAYRIFAGINPDLHDQNSSKPTAMFKPAKVAGRESFEILADYRDPFLGTLVNDQQLRLKPTKIKKSEPILFPEIEYKGMFKPGDHSKTVFLIMINGSQEIFKIRETHQEVKLLKGDQEKIIVKYKTEKKTYFLKKLN